MLNTGIQYLLDDSMQTSLGQLIAAVHGDRVRRYRYDELGNRVKSWTGGKHDVGETTLHSYNALNQLIRTQEGDDVREYRYDGRGNLTEIAENGRSKARYVFDATNMMTEAFVAGKGRAKYTYNGLRDRVGKLEGPQGADDPAKKLRYVLDMTLPYNNLLMTLGPRNQSFVWGNELISANGNEKYYCLRDHLGSPIRLLDGDGTGTLLAYDEFGVPLAGAAQNGKGLHNPFGLFCQGLFLYC
jgi:YD repeat-containing protein